MQLETIKFLYNISYVDFIIYFNYYNFMNIHYILEIKYFVKFYRIIFHAQEKEYIVLDCSLMLKRDVSFFFRSLQAQIFCKSHGQLFTSIVNHLQFTLIKFKE